MMRHTILLRAVLLSLLPASVPAGMASTPLPPVAFTAEVLPGVAEFALSRSRGGRLSLVYCDQDCTTIYYSVLSELGIWSAPEVVKANGVPRILNFAMDIDPSGTPHVVWGEGVGYQGTGSIHHADRQTDGAWSDVTEASGSYGRLNALRIAGDGGIELVTTSDYTVGGGYVFSNVFYLHGPLQGPLAIEGIDLAGEYIWDVDIALDGGNRPVFAVAQQYWGGRFASKLVYREESQWKERELGSAWNYCAWPLQLAIGAAINVQRCGNYARLADPEAAVSWAPSLRDDMTIDESDSPYFVAASGSNVTLGGMASDGFLVVLPVEDPSSTCGADPCPSYTASRLLYDKDQILVAYLGDDHGLRVKGYLKDQVGGYFHGEGVLTVTKVGAGTGVVTPTPVGTDWGNGMTSYPDDTMVTLTAAPATDSIFLGWSGDCAGTAPSCLVTVDVTDRKAVTAKFDWFAQTLRTPPAWRHAFGR